MEAFRDSGSTGPEVPGYDVGRLLGRGGTAAVWLVTERSTGREFALKCFDTVGAAGEDDGGMGAPETGQAMRRELLILSALDHDHLLRAHTVLRLRVPPSRPEGGDALGLLLDYAPGGSVAELVAGRGRLAAGETVTILTPIGQALEYLHENGVSHGDVSPGNVLFTAHGKPLLADAGMARLVADAGPAGDAGTAGFSDPSPVHAVRAGLQPERDVYSLAALGWYCLTGRPPVPGARRPPLPLLVPDVPPALAAALEAGLAEDPRCRPTAAELAAAVYRSSAAEPVDLSVTAHPSVVPQLLTRGAVPRNARERRAERVRGWFRRWAPGRPQLAQRRAAGPAAAHETGAPADIGHRPGSVPFAANTRAARTAPAGAWSRTAVPGARPPAAAQGAHSRMSPTAGRHAASGGTARRSAAGPWSEAGPLSDSGRRSARTGPAGVGNGVRNGVRNGVTDGVRDGGRDGVTDGVLDTADDAPKEARRDAGDRIRHDAGHFARQEPAPGTRRGTRRGMRAEAGPASRRGTPAPGRRRGRRKLWAGSVIAVVLLAGFGVARLPGGAGIPELFAASHPPTAAPGPATPGAAVDAIPAELRDLLGSADPAEAVRGLAALRSQAFRSGRLGLLEEVNVPGSDAAAADAGIAAPLAKSGHILSGFQTVLTSVRTVAEPGPARTVVAVRTSTSAYQERDTAGAVVARAPAGGESRLRLVLVNVDGRWRIAQVLAGDPAG
ncbi:protein kinase domain-containing protein [Arthrobacter oryzae]|uniref:non-specific serine/threonine protein kinase n=1 Tax=Arthrobacter oryzae TaxID=409290 RepID=A0A495EAB3_9MICC|nr:protein kinase [Arthrobacter oryzae]RKR13864.1 serine/threonine protein kinase [Arthrobacter oryzae]